MKSLSRVVSVYEFVYESESEFVSVFVCLWVCVSVGPEKEILCKNLTPVTANVKTVKH